MWCYRSRLNLQLLWLSTIGITCDDVPILSFGVVELVSELESAPGDLHEIVFGDEDLLLAGVVDNSKSYVIDDVVDCRNVVGRTMNLDSPDYLIQGHPNFWSAAQPMGRKEVGLGAVGLSEVLEV